MLLYVLNQFRAHHCARYKISSHGLYLVNFFFFIYLFIFYICCHTWLNKVVCNYIHKKIRKGGGEGVEADWGSRGLLAPLEPPLQRGPLRGPGEVHPDAVF